MISWVTVFVVCTAMLVLLGAANEENSFTADLSAGSRISSKRAAMKGRNKRLRQNTANELFGEAGGVDTTNNNDGNSLALRKQFKNGVVGSAEDADLLEVEEKEDRNGNGIGSVSVSGDSSSSSNRADDTSSGGIQRMFRRGFHKASYLLGNMTAKIEVFGRGRSRRKEVSIIHPETGIRTTYDLTDQKTEYEAEDLTMHMCNEPGEAYSAAWLTTKEHVLEVESESYNLTWVNCEMASFIHMRRSMKHFTDRHSAGMIMQSLDVLDFSVIHLSAFERSSKRYQKLLRVPGEKFRYADIPAVLETSKQLEKEINPKTSGKPIIWSTEAQRTVAVMPFLGGAMGAGHSELGNRFVYLHACFWSIYQFIPHIVAGVTRQADKDWILNESGLPFFDVIVLDNLPKSAGLPVGLTQIVKQRLSPATGAGVGGALAGIWADKFDYVYFTESDQVSE